MIVEGTLSRCVGGNDLFNKCKSVKRILVPTKDAFDKYEEIYEAILKITQSYEIDLILLAIGPPTATCLAFDLYNAEKRALDLGNLDIEYEWMNLGVENKVAVSGKYTHEVKNGNKNIEEIFDQKYENQIVYKIE